MSNYSSHPRAEASEAGQLLAQLLTDRLPPFVIVRHLDELCIELGTTAHWQVHDPANLVRFLRELRNIALLLCPPGDICQALCQDDGTLDRLDNLRPPAA